jgi:hypothetical protein
MYLLPTLARCEVFRASFLSRVGITVANERVARNIHKGVRFGTLLKREARGLFKHTYDSLSYCRTRISKVARCFLFRSATATFWLADLGNSMY